MPAPPPDARSFSAEAVSVTPCGDDGVILRIRIDGEPGALRAARFFMLRREDRMSPAIPRPFSIYRQFGNELEFLIKVMGQGTLALAQCTPGTRLRAIGPLGNGWPTLDGGGAPWVMLAGGIGSAPFFMAVEQAFVGMDGAPPARASDVVMLYGAARKGLLYDIEAFRELGVRVEACTDDGSAGMRGHVLQLLESQWKSGSLPREIRLLACGPERMLEAVEKLARARHLPCWLSLETVMGCGVGICNGCPVPTVAKGPMGQWPNAKCCVEGPVFSIDDVTVCAAH